MSAFAAHCRGLLCGSLVFLAAGSAWAEDYSSSTVESVEHGVHADSPERVDVVTAEDVERHGYSRLDELLADLPGVHLHQPTGTSTAAVVDGLPAGHVQILIDGQPLGRAVNSRTGPAFDVASVPVDVTDVARVEVYRGLGPAGSGDAGGVVINIVTKPSADTWRLQFRSRAGGGDVGWIGHSHAIGFTTPVAEQLHLELGATASQTFSVDVNDDFLPDLPDVRLFGGRLGLKWLHSRNEWLQGEIAVQHNRTLSPALTPERVDQLREEDPVRLFGVADMLTSTLNVDGRINGQWWLSRDLRLEHSTQIRWIRHDFDRVRVSDDERVPNHETSEINLRQGGLLTIYAGDHEIQPEILGNISHIQRESAIDEGAFATNMGSIGLGLSDNWQVNEALELSGRVFGEYHNEFGPGVVARVSAAWHVIPALTLRTSLSRSRRTPLAEELFFAFDHSQVGYIMEGNPELQPEHLMAARAGFTLGLLEGRLRLESEGYFHHVNDAISIETVSVGTGNQAARFRYVNLGTVQSAGLNSSVLVSAIPGGLSLRLSHAWLPLTRVEATGEALDMTSTHGFRAELMGRWLDRRLEARVHVHTRSEMAVPAGSPAAPAYVTLGGGVGWNFERGVRLALDLENLGNQTNATWGPKPGRSAFLSVAWLMQGAANE